jgi:hypothetical protein
MSAVTELNHEFGSETPWPGLSSFTEAGKSFFNGRDTETAEVQRLVRRETLTVLFGQSGLGKSSLLMAGLFPQLRAQDFLPVYVRLDHSDIAEARTLQLKNRLLAECAANQIDAPEEEKTGSLWEYLHRDGAAFWNEKNRVVRPVFVIDQFEEIFTVGRHTAPGGETSSQFAEALGDLAENRPSVELTRYLDEHPDEAGRYSLAEGGYKLVLSLREDYLAELETLRAQMRARISNRFRLTPLVGKQAMDAVLKTGGKLVDEPTAEQIVQFLAGTSRKRRGGYEMAEIDPALLSLVCTRLNAERLKRGGTSISSDLLEKSKDEILATFYGDSTRDIDPRARAFVEDKLLTEAGEYRNSFAVDDALRQPGVTRDALDHLVAQRLLRLEERSDVVRVELAHDVLVPVVKASRDDRRQQEQRAKEAEEQARREAELKENLRIAGTRARRNRIQSAVFAVLAVAAVIFGVYAQQQRRVAAEALKAANESKTIASVATTTAARSTEALQVATSSGIIKSEIADDLKRSLAQYRAATDSLRRRLGQEFALASQTAQQQGRSAGNLQQQIDIRDQVLKSVISSPTLSTEHKAAVLSLRAKLDTALTSFGFPATAR